MEEYCGDEILFKSFDELKQMIHDDKFDENTKQDIFETINMYIKNEDSRIDKDLLKYLFTGWAVHMNLKRNSKNDIL